MEKKSCIKPKYRGRVKTAVFRASRTTWVNLDVYFDPNIYRRVGVRHGNDMDPSINSAGSPITATMARNVHQYYRQERSMLLRQMRRELNLEDAGDDLGVPRLTTIPQRYDYDEDIRRDERADWRANWTPDRFPTGLVFEEVADETTRNILMVADESKEMPIPCTKCNFGSTSWWCRDCHVHLCRMCILPAWTTPHCTCTRMVRLWDPAFGSHWDKEQWVMRRLQWVNPCDVDELIERHDRNMCRLRCKAQRDAR